MDAAQLRGPGHLRPPIILVRVHRPPDVGLLRLEFGEFAPVMGLDVLVGVAPKRLVESAIGGYPTDPDDAANFVEGDAAQPERDDLLLAAGYVDLRLGCVLVAAGASRGLICYVIHCYVIDIVTGWPRLPQ